MTVLLIDDSALVIERLQEMLLPLPGVELIGPAANIPEALRSVRVSSPDVVVLDLNLPGGSGVTVLKTIKKEKPSTIVIVLTNYAFPQYEKKCFEAGADLFLDKSKDFARVPRLIQKLSTQLDRPRRYHSAQGSQSHVHAESKAGSR
jgi:DNA-binding NarL/FixJ family response regulator